MKKYVLILVSALLVVAACKKEEENPPEETQTNDSNSPIANAIIESSFDDMTNMTDQAITGTMVYYKSPKVKVVPPDAYEAGMYTREPCNVVISIDTTSSPKSITIDWGAANCDCNDGKQRRGKIVTTFTGKYRDVGTVITHTPVDYYVDDNKIEGSKSVTNEGLNSNMQPYFTISVDGTATLANGDVYSYTSNRVRTWTAGVATLGDFLDDEYEITGSATATSTTGEGYEAVITNALLVKVGCAFVTKGTLEFTPVGKLKRIIDYGDGTCDKVFTVTINGITFVMNG
ncbi:MAG: hypothetical protein EP338_12385 [Bacteroidetes bacterium]|nr:MAG: hypothetical protein EP338_12385 [Bacteroidota bacterium]